MAAPSSTERTPFVLFVGELSASCQEKILDRKLKVWYNFYMIMKRAAVAAKEIEMAEHIINVGEKMQTAKGVLERVYEGNIEYHIPTHTYHINTTYGEVSVELVRYTAFDAEMVINSDNQRAVDAVSYTISEVAGVK